MLLTNVVTAIVPLYTTVVVMVGRHSFQFVQVNKLTVSSGSSVVVSVVVVVVVEKTFCFFSSINQSIINSTKIPLSLLSAVELGKSKVVQIEKILDFLTFALY
jgi:hypothetical protein